jgi:hypothetical protein
VDRFAIRKESLGPFHSVSVQKPEEGTLANRMNRAFESPFSCLQTSARFREIQQVGEKAAGVRC